MLIVCILQYLPVYTPSEEEKQDAKLYAANVRRVMAKYVEYFKFFKHKLGTTNSTNVGIKFKDVCAYV